MLRLFTSGMRPLISLEQGDCQKGRATQFLQRGNSPMRYPTDPPLVTVFGGGGFVGRYVCEMLLRKGARLRVAENDPRRDHFLGPLADVGELYRVAYDLDQPDTIMRAMDGAEVVINLVSNINGERGRMHDHEPGTLAAAAWVTGAKSFVYVSAINAVLSEQTVRAGHPGATIIRPSVVFGPEDNYTNRIAAKMRFPIVPVIAPQTCFRPIYVCDLARAIVASALEGKAHAGADYEVAGPEAMTIWEVNVRIADMVGRRPKLVVVPEFLALATAGLRSDTGQMLARDAVPSGQLAGLEAFGITPTPLAAVAPLWLERYRSGGRFAFRKSLRQEPPKPEFAPGSLVGGVPKNCSGG